MIIFVPIDDIPVPLGEPPGCMCSSFFVLLYDFVGCRIPWSPLNTSPHTKDAEDKNRELQLVPLMTNSVVE